MCIRDRHRCAVLIAFQAAVGTHLVGRVPQLLLQAGPVSICLLYTSDAADERSSVDLGGRRIIKKKNNVQLSRRAEGEKKTTYVM